jgi:hypothetical protein
MSLPGGCWEAGLINGPSLCKTTTCGDRITASQGGRAASRAPTEGWSASYRSVGTGSLPLVANFVKKFAILDISGTDRVQGAYFHDKSA